MENNKISIFEVDDISKLANVMMENMHNGILSDAILFYKDASKLIKELLKHDEVNIDGGCGISIESPEANGYDGEFIVSLADDGIIGCEKACRESRYISGFQKFTAIDIDSKYPYELIEKCEYPFYVCLTCNDCENCDLCDKYKSNVDFITNDDGKVIAFRYECDDGEVKTCIYVETENEELLREYMDELGIECDE